MLPLFQEPQEVVSAEQVKGLVGRQCEDKTMHRFAVLSKVTVLTQRGHGKLLMGFEEWRIMVTFPFYKSYTGYSVENRLEKIKIASGILKVYNIKLEQNRL